MKSKNPRHLKIEVCVDSVASALAAEKGAADRVELCDNLMEGGTTPSAGAIALARQHLRIGLHVIIRPRGGDFHYSPLEFDIMARDIAMARELGADGVVLGLLTPGGKVDKPRTRRLIELARPLAVTFHRAFDMTRDPYEALEDLVALGVDRVLTSGQEACILEGLDLVAKLLRRAGRRIIVMPGGPVRTMAKVITCCPVKEVHVYGTMSVGSAMRYRNPRVFMGGELRPPEYDRLITDPDQVRRLRRATAV